VSLTVLNAMHEGSPVGLRSRDGLIRELGGDVRARDGDEVIDAAGMPIVPGLVNGHTHAAMTLFRGYGDDLPLMQWLEQKIWPAEARLDDDDVYWGTRLACAEMIRTGTVRFWDMYWRPGATARAVEEAGLRATIGAPLLDGNDPTRTAQLRDSARSSIETLAGASPRIAPAFAPHAIYTVSEPSLEWIAAEAADRELPIQIHLSETEKEVSDCVEAHGVRPAAYLDRLGLLGPRTLIAHGVWLDDEELDLVAQRGATLVTNPVANLKLAVGGVFPYRRARERAIPVGLGTDGPGSNNSLDLFQDVKVFALLQKHEAGDPAAVTAQEAWTVATGAGAPLLGASGRLAPGEPADFLLLRRDAPELSLGNLVADLVYAASGAVVDTTVADGRVLMRGGIVEGLEELRERGIEHAHRLGIAG
jgi:5-methylthioadenosine/S-adenosylhomocysteine deaminase